MTKAEELARSKEEGAPKRPSTAADIFKRQKRDAAASAGEKGADLVTSQLKSNQFNSIQFN